MGGEATSSPSPDPEMLVVGGDSEGARLVLGCIRDWGVGGRVQAGRVSRKAVEGLLAELSSGEEYQ